MEKDQIRSICSKYFIAIRLPDLEALTILEAWVNIIILAHRVPEFIHTDNGSSLSLICSKIHWTNESNVPQEYVLIQNEDVTTEKYIGLILLICECNWPNWKFPVIKLTKKNIQHLSLIGPQLKSKHCAFNYISDI